MVTRRVLVTGAAGAVGSALVPVLRDLGHDVVATDINDGDGVAFMDVCSSGDVWNVVAQSAPDTIVHLAASKLAVEGELHPDGFVRTNIVGTQNVVAAAKARKAKLVFASTCKAADPETVYGSCKLIGERMVLSAGGTVLRFFNILECGPSVATIWEQIPAPEPIPFTDCWRYFTTVRQAVRLVVLSLDLSPGRYAIDPGQPRHMQAVARDLHPHRELVMIPRRRGDRFREPAHAKCERVYRAGDVWTIVGAHDPERVTERVAA